MPCNSDYMNPRFDEQESKRAAQFIVYLDLNLGIKTPEWIIQANLNTYGSPNRLNELVKMLCSICTNLGEDAKNKLIYNGKDATARDLADWWEQHQKADEERIEKEKKEKNKKKLIKKALSKLSKSERKALGFND